MGVVASVISDVVTGIKTKQRILMLGLDAAGKTTALRKMKLGEVKSSIPTIGFNVEEVTVKNITFTCWDLGGDDDKIKPLWHHYYDQGVTGIIFVIDSNDRDRLDDIRKEVHELLAEPKLKDAKILLLANKQDLPNAMCGQEITDKMGCESGPFAGRIWYVQCASATTGEGLYEWLGTMLSH